VGTRVSALVNNTRPIPNYFGIQVEVAGKAPAFYVPDLGVWYYEQKPGGGKASGGFVKAHTGEQAPGSGHAAKLESGAELVKATVYLTSRRRCSGASGSGHFGSVR